MLSACIMMYIILILVGFVAGLLSGSVGFGGGMILLPVITYFYGVDIAVPVSTLAQMLSNISRAGMGFSEIKWKKVGFFLIAAAPLTVLGAVGFAKVTGEMKPLMTRILCVCLILFAIIKVSGKIRLPKGNGTVLAGGGITGFVNGMLGISGPLSSAVFLTLELTPVAYIASEATAAAIMHIIKAIVYSRFALIDLNILLQGLFIGAAMMAGNWIAMKFIRNVEKKNYSKLVCFCMIALSVFLFFSAE